MRLTKCNLNNRVKFKIRPDGERIWVEFWRRSLPDHVPIPAIQRDAEGFVTAQLWSVMQMFGPFMDLGADPPIEADFQIEVTTPQSVQEQFVDLIAAMLADGGGGRAFGPDRAVLSRCRCDVYADGRVASWDVGEIPLDDAGRAAVARAFVDARAKLTTYDGRRWLRESQGRKVGS